jgi:hypothetical protein
MAKKKWRIGLILFVLLSMIIHPALIQIPKAQANLLEPILGEEETSTEEIQLWEAYDRPVEYQSYITDEDVFITMRDGVILVANVYRPDGPGPFPVILTQTPYNKNNQGPNEYLVKRGYAHVVVDVLPNDAKWKEKGEFPVDAFLQR